jgi:tetratricopeptide (TPR) repeat protein
MRRVALAAVAWLTVFGPATSEPVDVRAGLHDAYGRIVFNWSTPVFHQSAVSGNSVVVRFGRSIEADYRAALKTLGKYLTDAQPGADGQSVTFSLRGGADVHSFSMGRAVVVDFLNSSPAAPILAPASRGAGAAPGGPVVSVRAGEHDGYSRIVFDWSRRVGYKVEQAGAVATVTFDRPAQFGLETLLEKPIKFIGDAKARASDGGVTVTLSIPEASRMRDFRSGSKVVVDVLAPGTGVAVSSTAKTAAQPPAAKSKSPAAGLKQPAPSISTQPRPSQATAPGSPAPTAVASSPPPVAPKQGAKTPKAAAAPPTSLVPGKHRSLTSPAVGGGAQVSATPPPQPSSTAAPLDAVTLRFDWQEPVAAAVFRRAGSLWVIFDQDSPVDIASLKAASGNVVRAIEKVPTEQATVLRFDTVAGVNPGLRRDGLAWMLDFRQQPLGPSTPIEAEAQPNSPIGARIFLPVPEPGRAVVVRDTDVGDNLVVIPVIPLGYGIERRREYPQLQILPSAQGVVVRPRIDDLRVRPLRQGIELTSGGGLQISSVTPQAAAAASLGVMRPLTRIFDLGQWREGELSDFIPNRQRLQRAIAKANEANREALRLDLARYYFSLGLAAETNAVLRVAGEGRPEIEGEPEFRAMRGASNFLMGRYDDAASDLGDASLDGNDEADFWRAALSAAADNLVGAAPTLKRTGGIIRPYPKALKVPLGLLVVRAAIATGDIKQATHHLEVLGIEEPTPSQSSQLAYVQGRLAELSGNFDEAIAKWEEVENGTHRPSRAMATVARAELLLKQRNISPAEAIKEFEKLRFSWRGDDFEFRLLRRLGDLYLAEGDYGSGLRTLRQAATYFRKHKEAAQVTQQMTDAFSRLYLEGVSGNLPPVAAIALYDEFKVLTPSGEKGDEMIRKLADRLVSVDLLKRGAELLEAQVKFRLKGVDKARVGAQLALIHILDKKPQKAEEVLKGSRGPGLPDELAARRRHLLARALSGMGRKPEAMVLLEGDESRDADLLRVDFSWEKQNWGAAAKALRRIVRGIMEESHEPLDDAKARYVLNLAIALTLSGNERAVDRLRRDYAEVMGSTSFRDAFLLIVSPGSRGLADYRTIANKVGVAEKFQGFMATYRERLKAENLSKIY